MISLNGKEYEPEYYNANFIFTYVLYFIFLFVRPLYEFIRSFLKGRDNSIIQIEQCEKKYQFKMFLKKITNVLFIAAIILYIPEVDEFYNKIPILNKLDKNILAVIILVLGMLILNKSK